MNASRVRFYETMYHDGQHVPELRHFYNYVMSGGRAIRSNRKRKRKLSSHHKVLDDPPAKHDYLFVGNTFEDNTALSSLSEDDKDPQPKNKQRKIDDDSDSEEEEESTDNDEEEEEESTEEDKSTSEEEDKSTSGKKKDKKEDEESASKEEESVVDDDDDDDETTHGEEEESLEEDDKEPCDKTNIGHGSVENFLSKLEQCILNKSQATNDDNGHESEDTEPTDRDKDTNEERQGLLRKIQSLEEKLGDKPL